MEHSPKFNDHAARAWQYLRRPQVVAALVIALGVALSYAALAQGFPGAFLLDDRARITGVDIEGLEFGPIYRAILEANSGLLGRPVSLYSLYVTKGIYGENPVAFRYENILYHLLTGLLLFWMLGRLFASSIPRHETLERHAWPTAAVLTTIWLVHPLHVSTALYTVQRMTELSTIFTLCALISFIVGRQALLRGRSTPIVPFVLLPVFMLLGIFSKEDAALVPVYLLLLELTVFRLRAGDGPGRLQLKAVLAVFVAAPLLLGGLYFLLKLPELMNDYLMRDFSLLERLATETVVVWRYVGMLLIPRLSGMSLFHDSIPILEPLDPAVMVATIAWIAVLGYALYCMRSRPLVSLGILMFLAAHAMESTVIPLELMFEHRNYLASVGILLAAYGFLAPLWSLWRRRVRVAAGAGLVVFVAFLTVLQAVRADGWKNEAELLLITAQEHPESIRTKSMLANHLLESGHIGRAKQLMAGVIEANESSGRNLTGMHLHLLLMHCYDREFPAQLYERTKHLLGTQPLNAYSVSGIKALQKQVVKQHCPAIPVEKMIELNVVAAGNDDTRERYRFLTKAMAGSILGGHGDMERARPLLASALEHEHRVPVHLRVDTLTRLAEACLQTGDSECASGAIEDARALLESAPFDSALSEREKRLEFLEGQLEPARDASMEPAPDRASAESSGGDDPDPDSR